MFDVDVPNVTPTRLMQTAYIIAILGGLWLTWQYNRQLIGWLNADFEQARLERAYRRMLWWRRAALWCGTHSIEAELRYQEMV
jgi:hypothetical protein